MSLFCARYDFDSSLKKDAIGFNLNEHSETWIGGDRYLIEGVVVYNRFSQFVFVSDSARKIEDLIWAFGLASLKEDAIKKVKFEECRWPHRGSWDFCEV